MRKNKRFWLLSVVSVFLLSLFISGCKPAKDNSSGNGSGEESKKEVVDNAAADKIDMNGYTFTLASHWANDYFQEPGNTDAGDKIAKRIAEIEEYYNCKIDYIQDIPQLMHEGFIQASAAGQKFADIYETNLHAFRELYEAGYFKEFQNLAGIDVNATKWGEVYKKTTTHDGKTYGLNFTSWYHRMPHFFYATYFNKDVLAKFNQPDPYTLIEKGEWTWEKFQEIAKACTARDAAGATTSYGFTSIDRMAEFTILYANGARVTTAKENGKLVGGFNNEKAYKAVDFAKQLMQDDKVFLNLHDPRTAGDWIEPFRRFRDGESAFFLYHTEALEWQGWLPDMESPFGMVPFPKGPDATEWGSAVTGDLRIFALPAVGEGLNHEYAVRIFNMLTNPLEGTEVDSWKEYALKHYFVNDDKAFKYYEEMLAVAEYDHSGDIGGAFHEYENAVFTVTRDNARTAKEALDSVRDQVNSEIELYYNSKIK